MAAKKKEMASETVTITKPTFRTQVYRIRGTSPLHCNQMSPETRQKLLNSAVGEKVAGAKPKPKTDEQQMEDSLYRLSKNDPWRAKGFEYGFPGRGLKKALIEAGRLTERTMVEIKQLLRIKAELVPLCKGEPRFHAEIINKDKGGSCASIRAKFDEWEMLVPINFLEGGKGLSASEVGSLFALAGETVGLGCGRIINGGNNGAFEVVEIQEAPR